jgi:outer membrane protein assembly factor BamB
MRIVPMKLLVFLCLMVLAGCGSAPIIKRSALASPPAQTSTSAPQTPTSTPLPTATPIPFEQQSVYAALDSGVVALNASTGAVRWRYRSMGQIQTTWSRQGKHTTDMALSGGVLYIGSTVGIEAVDASSGAGLWQARMGLVVGSPLVSAGMVYVATSAEVVALGAQDGQVRWSDPLSPHPLLQAISDGIVYVESDVFRAFDALTGHLLWQAPIWLRPDSFMGAAQGAAYFTTEMSLTALNARDGSLRWNAGFYDAGFIGFIDRVVYAASGTGYVFALKATDGSKIWELQGDAAASAPTVDDFPLALGASFLYRITAPGTIQALRLSDGSQQWKVSGVGDAWMALQGEAQGALYYCYSGSAEGTGIGALNVSDGAIRWQAQISAKSQVLPGIEGVTNGALYVITLPGVIEGGIPQAIDALSISDGSLLWQYAPPGLLPGALVG